LSTSPVWQQQQQPLEPERQEQQQQQEPRPNSVSQQQQDSASNGTNPSNHTPAPDATAAAAAPAAAAAAAAADAAGKKPSSNFAKRVVFGLILGLGGAAVVAAGGVPYLLVALLVVYQATQEYFGFITSKGISQGMTPPPVFVSIATTALCLSITLFTFVSR
jgi:phosphatidate cytidylyltransferase